MSKHCNQTIAELISSINYSIKELNKRGIHLINYDNAVEQLKGVSVLRGKVKYMVQVDAPPNTQHTAKDNTGDM